MIQLITFSKKKVFFIWFLIIFLPGISFSQKQEEDQLNVINDTTYFDIDWEQVLPTSNQAKYYRTFEQEQGFLYVQDHYLSNDQIQNRGKVFSIDPLKYQGMVVWFHENGNLSRKAIYQSGNITGDEIIYFQSGNPMEHFKHKGGKRQIIQMWDENGQELLENGNGIVTRQGSGNTLIEHMVIENNDYKEYYTIRNIERDTIYSHVEVPAEFKGGMGKFYQRFAQEMRYPNKARKAGIEGRVYVQFLITKEGEVTEAKVTKGIGEECDAEAIRAVNAIKGWKPAMNNNKEVTTRMVLPIIFKLS